jgi:hypothetical protein
MGSAAAPQPCVFTLVNADTREERPTTESRSMPECCAALTGRRLTVPHVGFHQLRTSQGTRESLRAIEEGLDKRGIPAARGGKWSATQKNAAAGG